MTDHWVINASPLILLGKAGQLDWLPELGTVVIPAAVVEEIKAGATTDPARRFVESTTATPFFKEVRTGAKVTAWDLGAGESAVISWAIENSGYEAVLDDAAARRCGTVFGIPLRGTLSLVALAKKRGWIPECRPVFSRMLEAGIYVSPSLIEQVAKSAGE